MTRTIEIAGPDGTRVRRRPIVGDLRWDGRVWQRWSGRRWSRAAYSLHPERLLRPTSFDEDPAIDRPGQARALALAVEHQVATNGASVVHDGPSGVVLAYRRPVSHVAHALLTLLTAGLWGIVWIVMALSRAEDRVLLEVDRWGNVWARPVAAR